MIAIVKRILSQMPTISTTQNKFLTILFSTMITLRGRANFRNMSRYCDLHEKTFSRNFRKSFDFSQFNHLLIRETVPANNQKIAAIDASHVPKSGKQSAGIDFFWSGVANRSKKGQEISALALIDLDYNTAYTLSVEQTPASSERLNKEENRIDFYLQQVKRNQSYLQESQVTYIAADGYYSKRRFIDGIVKLGFHQIGRLRIDANLRYLYEGERTGLRGRPKLYDGKVDYDDFSKWDFICEIKEGVSLYSAILNSPCFKRNLKIICMVNHETQSHVLFFSTDITLSAEDLLKYYRARFQIEFLFRDAKQFTGLTDCQARNKEALHFHFNASLSTLNLLKNQDRKQSENSASKVCSIASWKARYFNEHLLEQFISSFDLDPIHIKNRPEYERLRSYGAIAA